ncbi:GNAT family N-acetyltransferase [Shewanella maritima]|uniref:GNAT family N-acetyltransferase n=1 Tax=Shewanella maritima TaxID=2520507 RepID=A0A411PFF2_9GAMM|nr:GNAT family N-acetyltransferase [Shewanella maritima]QBF82120.1 GNAT family N-acetyltransferase [Shewanella maritima]
MIIRPIAAGDWLAIMTIQSQCYPQDTCESKAVLQDKAQRFAESCLVVEFDGQVAAYVFAHPWQQLDAPSLNLELTSIESADCLYIHDMAVSPNFQGKGIAKQLFKQLLAIKQQNQLGHMALVALPEALTFWQTLGFSAPNVLPDKVRASLASYPENTQYLTRS